MRTMWYTKDNHFKWKPDESKDTTKKIDCKWRNYEIYAGTAHDSVNDRNEDQYQNNGKKSGKYN